MKPKLTPIPTGAPPPVQEHHVKLPEELAVILNAASAHARGLDGRGVRVAVIDSGFFAHPFYTTRGYQIHYVPTEKEPAPHVDEYGHGTAQLASFFSLAPGAQALAIKCMDRDPSAALETAIALKPDVLSCAWGFNIDRPGAKKLPKEYQRMHALLKDAIASGICVVGAAGNGQYAFPGNMPEVISAGGAYYGPDQKFSESDIASIYESSIFPGRMIPDVCGPVGMLPHGRLLLVPVPPQAKLAKRPAFSTIAAGESSSVKAVGGGKAAGGATGWAMFSGTSAATAMVSGACAVLLQAKPGLKPDEIRQILVQTAREVPEAGIRVLNVEAAVQRVSG